MQPCCSMPIWVNSDCSPEAVESDNFNELHYWVYMEKPFSWDPVASDLFTLFILKWKVGLWKKCYCSVKFILTLWVISWNVTYFSKNMNVYIYIYTKLQWNLWISLPHLTTSNLKLLRIKRKFLYSY